MRLGCDARRFPFYWEMKALLILWLTLPQIQVRPSVTIIRLLLGLIIIHTQGSTYIYTALIHPFLLNHEQEIDDTLAEFKGKARAAGASWINAMFKRVKEALVGGLVVRFFFLLALPLSVARRRLTPERSNRPKQSQRKLNLLINSSKEPPLLLPLPPTAPLKLP